MAIKTKGINHPALIGQSREETIKFYTEVLGMRLVLDQPNLDEPRMQHLFFDMGNGNFLAYFVINEGTDLKLPQSREGIGSMGHVALNLDAPIHEAIEALQQHNVEFVGPIDGGTSGRSISGTPMVSWSNCFRGLRLCLREQTKQMSLLGLPRFARPKARTILKMRTFSSQYLRSDSPNRGGPRLASTNRKIFRQRIKF